MTRVTATFAEDELAELDELCWIRRTSRADAIRTAVEWYTRWADRLPYEEDPREDYP